MERVQIGCSRVAPSTSRLCERFFSARRKPSTSRGMNEPNGELPLRCRRLFEPRADRVRRLVKDDLAIGPLLEHLVLGELTRQLEWSKERATLGHDRTRDGIKVDGLLEAADGRAVGVEVKTGETVRTDDFRSLRHLQATAGRIFHRGFVLHGGHR